MRHRGLIIILIILFVVIVAGFFFAGRISISALDEPGQLETYMATKAKKWIIARSARGPHPKAPANDAASVAIGQMAYGGECASCHGTDGRTPTDVGRWMYPRTLDLGSTEVQGWSDAELFWIIKHGIRLSGMPGFGRTRSDEQIWHFVHYVRSLDAGRQGIERRP